MFSPFKQSINTVKENFMNIKSILIIMASLVFFLPGGLLTGDAFAQNPNRPTEHNLVVTKVNDEWRVIVRDNHERSTIIVNRGDRIRWTVEESDASFQFEDESLFGGNTRTVRSGNPLVLAVGNNARIGSHTYAVFVHSDHVFARGESPPRIFVQR
jgi:hypothetical protein